MKFKTKPIVSLLTLAILAGCGGGSGGDSTSPTPTPTPPVVDGENQIVVADSYLGVGQPTELVLFYPNDEITNITWQQTSGPQATLQSVRSKMLTVVPSELGNYEFQVSFNRNGVSESETASINVIEQTLPVKARLGHAALEGNKVSLRAHLNNDVSNADISWQQIDGPTVSITTGTGSSRQVLFFDAPEVTKDTLLTFAASANINGESISDNVTVLVENTTAINDSALFDDRKANVYAYKSNSPYANVLKGCIYNNTMTSNDTCRFSELPLIAQDSLTPTIDDIMNRVVVSHDWMGERFEEFLTNHDPHGDFRNLLRATTGVVISYDVRPSFYWAATGAIYLDPTYFWTTPEERDTINEAPDFRSSFGESLQFEMPWRYIKDNDYASAYFAPDQRVERTMEDGLYRLAALMYHELAHANDFFPSSIWSSLDMSDPILVAANKIGSNTGYQSDLLNTALPLLGNEMRALAGVRFGGSTATQTQEAYTPADVAGFFSHQGAPQFYSYTSRREDYAILFDGFMMNARYGVQRDVAITNKPSGDNVSASDYIVTWGQRGRIGDENIKPRLHYVLPRILPEFTDANSIISNLPAPTMMTVGNDWLENLSLGTQKNKTSIAEIMLMRSKEESAMHRPVNVLPMHQSKGLK